MRASHGQRERTTGQSAVAACMPLPLLAPVLGAEILQIWSFPAGATCLTLHLATRRSCAWSIR